MNEETALLQLTGDASVQKRFLEMSHLYDAAIREIRTRLEILDREFSILYASNPIHHIESRLKSPRSILAKVERKGLQLTVEAAEEHLQDIAGVRIICNYIDDIYRLADLITRQQDIELVEQVDYIRQPKPNGYRSLHLIVSVPIFLHNEKKSMKVEVQLRTLAMDLWASTEHKIRYKKDIYVSPEDSQALLECAHGCSEIDRKLEQIYHNVNKFKTEQEKQK